MDIVFAGTGLPLYQYSLFLLEVVLANGFW